MGLLSRLKDWITAKDIEEFEEYEYRKDNGYFDDGYMKTEIPEIETIDRAEVDMSSRHLRQRYIKNLCDLMAECTDEIENASREYRYVTDYLRDCEIIEQIPEDSNNSLVNSAENVIRLMKKNQIHTNKLGRISESKYNQMQNIAGDMPKAFEELKANEEYKEIVRDDLRKLEGEKVSRQFMRSDARVKELSCRNIAVITVFAMAFVMIILLLMKFMFDMKVMPGFIIAAALGSVTLAVTFSSFLNSRSLDTRLTGQLNQIISKQNTIKIKYVNVQNLITYQYEKYHVNSSEELAYYWALYLDEKKERDLIRRMSHDLDNAEERFMQELINANVSFPTLWLHQAEAVADKREMVELRHELVARRQGLRKRISYNTDNREAAKKEVQDLVMKYPNYANEILEIVGSYDDSDAKSTE